MPKLHALTLAALTLTISVPACDPAPDQVDGLQFREGVNAEFGSLESARKLLADCVDVDRPVTFTLVRGHIYDPATQSFNVLLESTAPIGQVDCILAVLEASQ